MADTKLIDLPPTTTLDGGDLLYVVTDPGGTPVSKHITIDDFIATMPPSGASALDDLTDVNAPTPASGEVLTWDPTPGEWVAAPLPPGRANALDDLTDVDATTPADGEVLTWDAGTSSWKSAAVGAPSAGVGPLVFLEEVVLSSPAASLHAENWYSADYDVYIFELLNVKNTVNTQNFCMRVSTDGGATWVSAASSYYWAWNHAASGSSGGVVGSGAPDTEVTLFTQVNNTGNNEGVSGPLRLFRPGVVGARKTGLWQFYTAQSADIFSTNGSFLAVGTAAINGIQFFFASGNVASGVCTEPEGRRSLR